MSETTPAATTHNSQDKDPTLHDVLNAINTFANGVTAEFAGVKNEFAGVKNEFAGVKKRLTHIENVMVTKDYLDEKMAEQRADLILLTRKEDRKVVALIEELRQSQVLSDVAAKRILALEPFPQT